MRGVYWTLVSFEINPSSTCAQELAYCFPSGLHDFRNAASSVASKCCDDESSMLTKETEKSYSKPDPSNACPPISPKVQTSSMPTVNT